jgi:hypothetical protein
MPLSEKGMQHFVTSYIRSSKSRYEIKCGIGLRIKATGRKTRLFPAKRGVTAKMGKNGASHISLLSKAA